MVAADVPVNAHVHGVAPPFVFAGDRPDGFDDLSAETAALLPRASDYGDAADHVDLENSHVLFITNVSVDIGGRACVDLGPGARWCPADGRPGGVAFSEHFAQFDRTAINRPLGGVITVDAPKGQSVDDRRSHSDTAATRVRRFCTLLNVLCNVYSYLIARRTLLNRLQGGTNEIREVYTGITYRHSSIPFSRVPKRLTPAELELAAWLAFSPRQENRLVALIQRATDSLTLARTLTDRAIAHVLTWAAIECLISQKEGELITNMTLCLLGLNTPVASSMNFWSQAKSSYAARSSIVHGFDVPTPTQLAEVTAFAETQASMLLRHVCERCRDRDVSRDRITAELRARALRGAEL